MNSPHMDGVSPAQINAELNRVIASSEFENSERMKSFLSYLVTETVEGRSERLKGYNIGVDVFERGDDFDPQTNPIVRVEAGRLRRLLNNYYLGAGDGDPVRITIPKGAYVPLFERKSGGNGGSRERVSSERADRQALAMPRGPSIAVLPFDNLSADPQQALFGDGLSEEITTQLSRFSTLFVVARHTAFQYRQRDADVRKIGQDLEVHYVLEGSVRSAGTSIRVTAQLIDATSGLHVWAENYDRELTVSSLIGLQDDIAQSVAASIAEPHGAISRYDLTRARRAVSEDMDLYNFSLRWFEYTRQYDPESHAKLREAIPRMLKKHPHNSLVWTVRGLLALDEEGFGYDLKAEDTPALDRALEYCNKAIQLDSSNQKSYQYLLAIHYLRGDVDMALETGRKALMLNPNDTDALAEYGFYLCYSGDWNRGLEFMQKSISLNPLHSPFVYTVMCLERYRVGDDEAALAYAQKLEMPGFFWSHFFRAITNAQLNRAAAAKTALEALLKLRPDFATDAETELRKWLKEEPLVQRCLEGLCKAGLM